jgi:hypothetical protein
MIYAIVDNRSTGKTNLAIDLYIKDPKNNMLFCASQSEKKEMIIKILAKYPTLDTKELVKRIKVAGKNAVIGNRAKDVIFDEFFANKNKEDLIFAANPTVSLDKGNIYIIGTYKDRIYDKSFITRFKAELYSVKSFRAKLNLNPELEKFETFYNEFEEDNS